MNYKSPQTNKNKTFPQFQPQGKMTALQEENIQRRQEWGKTTKGIKLRSERLNSGQQR